MLNFLEVIMCGQIESVSQNQIPNGKTVLRAQVKVVKTYNQQTFESKWNVDAWEDKGSVLAKCMPGTTILVKGTLQNKKVVDANGQEKWHTSIIADSIGVVSGPPQQVAGYAQPQQQQYAPPQQQYAPPAQQRPTYQITTPQQQPAPQQAHAHDPNASFGQQSRGQVPFGDIPF